MKRTEAIEWLEVMKENAIFEQYDALKMAIEALQITETPTDLVSRADVVKEFIKLFCCIKDVLDIEEWKDICQTTVREVPSAKTPNNTQTDLISRADAIEAIYACHPKGRQSIDNQKFHYGNYTQGLYDAICAVKNCDEVTLPSTKTTSDLINRQDALKPFCIAPDGTRIPEVDCDNFPVEFSVEFIKKHLLSLPSADAVSREEYDQLEEMYDAIRIYDSSAKGGDAEMNEVKSPYMQPSPNGADLISRADAIELCAEAQGRASTKAELKGISKVWKGLLKLPSIDVVSREAYEKVLIECGEVKTKLGELQQTIKANQGKWIKTVDGNGWNDWYVLKCPFCGAIIEDKHYHSWEYNFCPNCGERVWGEKHE